jgi:hypothetical protein
MPSVKPKEVEVTLIAPHIHKGKQYKKGDKITVTADQELWLAKQNLIKGAK